MSNNLNLYFSCGEFAKFFNVTKHTLFHYDEIGVFSPAMKGENNYRMYGIEQVEVFKVILTLKDLGMPLKEIKEYMERRSPEEFITLMEDRKKIIEENILQLEKIKKIFHEKMEITKESIKLDKNVIAIKKYQKEYLISIKTEINNERDVSIYVAEHIKFCQEKGVYSPHAISGTQNFNTVLNGNYYKYTSFYTKITSDQLYLLKDKSVTFIAKEEGDYIVTYHSTGYLKLGETYQKIISFIQKNNLEVVGDFYEDVLLDELSIKGYENYLVQISIRINKKNL